MIAIILPENDVDEEKHKEVQIQTREPPDKERTGLVKVGKGGKDIVTIHERKETLGCASQGLKLPVIRTKYDPARKAESTVKHQDAEEKAKNAREGVLECDYENIILGEEGQVTKEATPDEQIAHA